MVDTTMNKLVKLLEKFIEDKYVARAEGYDDINKERYWELKADLRNLIRIEEARQKNDEIKELIREILSDFDTLEKHYHFYANENNPFHEIYDKWDERDSEARK